MKDCVRIQDLVAEYTGLGREQNGKFMVRCPFHMENNPSMVVRIHNKTFKCYACGVSGDVFGFVMEMTGCSFYEALTSLEASAGITPPAKYNSSEKPLTPKSKFAANVLPSSTADATSLTPGGASDGTLFGFGGVKKEVKKEEELSRVMLIELNTEFLKVLGAYDPQCEGLMKVYMNFEVGVSPWHWSYRGDKLFKGMLDRVVFPLRDAQGVLVGFSARHKSALPPPDGWGKGCPKYINSAGSALFKKRELLYGLHRTAKAIRLRGFAFLVEGYKDVLAMVAAGFGNTAGLCGLEITEGHLDLLAGLCTRVVLLTDGDGPGQAAVPKFEGLLKGAGFGVLSLSLPDGEDPDSLFRQLGAEGLRTLIESLLCPPRLLSPVLSCSEQVKPSPEEVESSPAAVEPAAVSEEDLLIRDVDSLVASLAYVARPTEKQRMIARLSTLREQLVKVSALLNRPPSVL